jgi:hypothetical protein
MMPFRPERNPNRCLASADKADHCQLFSKAPAMVIKRPIESVIHADVYILLARWQNLILPLTLQIWQLF